MIGYGLRDILGKVFYSLQDTKTPMINGIIAMLLNITLNILFVKFTNMQIAGLAFATSISALLTITLLFINLQIKIGNFGLEKILIVMVKSLLSAILMGIVARFVYNSVFNILGDSFIDQVITLGSSVLSGALTYGIAIIVLKVEEVNLILGKVKTKLKIR